MKKILLFWPFYGNGLLPKLVRSMNLIFVLTIFCCFRVSASVFSLELFTLDINNVSVTKVFDKIQKESDYRIFNNYGYLKHLNKVSMSVKTVTRSTILDKILHNKLKYRILSDNLVIIYPKDIKADRRKIEGLVTDDKGNPLSSVTVLVKGTSSGTLTDEKGRISLTVEDDGILSISFIGYQARGIIVGNKSNFNIQLKLSASDLNEVAVTPLGISKEKKSLRYAVIKVPAKELNSAGKSSMILTLDGKVPGLEVQTCANGLDGTPRVLIKKFSGAQNRPITTYAELMFIKAEVTLKNMNLGRSTQQAYEAGITANMRRLGINPAGATVLDHFEDPLVAYLSPTAMKQSVTQRNISQFGQSTNTFSLIRRTDFPELDYFTIGVNKENGWSVRIRYVLEKFKNYNNENFQAAIAGINIINRMWGDKLWFAQDALDVKMEPFIQQGPAKFTY